MQEPDHYRRPLNPVVFMGGPRPSGVPAEAEVVDFTPKAPEPELEDEPAAKEERKPGPPPPPPKPAA